MRWSAGIQFGRKKDVEAASESRWRVHQERFLIKIKMYYFTSEELGGPRAAVISPLQIDLGLLSSSTSDFSHCPLLL